MKGNTVNTLTTIAFFATIATLSVLGMEGTAPQTTAPTSPEHERVLNRFLRSFNSGDRVALTEFASSCLTEAARRGRSASEAAQNDLDVREQAGGGFDLCRIEKNAGAELVALLKSRGEFSHYARLTMTFNGAQPDLIVRRGLGETDPPADLLPPRQSPEALAVDIDAKLARLVREDRFSGAVMIARNGKPVWHKAYGYANREEKTPNRLDTRFRLGSMNKMITSVAIAQLVEAGKLKYTETLAEALPDYPDMEVAQKITLHHLLTHTSGLGDIFTPEFEKTKESLHVVFGAIHAQESRLAQHESLLQDISTEVSQIHSGGMTQAQMNQAAVMKKRSGSDRFAARHGQRHRRPRSPATGSSRSVRAFLPRRSVSLPVLLPSPLGQPQTKFQLQRLTAEPFVTALGAGLNPYYGLGVTDIKVGQRSQFAATGTNGAVVPLSRYQPTMFDGLLDCDVADVSQFIYIFLANASTSANTAFGTSRRGNLPRSLRARWTSQLDSNLTD